MINKHHVSIKGQHLKEFRYSVGGGMSGGYYFQKVIGYGDHAVIRTEEASWHGEEPKIREYLADISLMDELEQIVRREKMNYWNGKKFTSMFVCDGESEDYRFDFEKNSIDFSSQIYPEKYREKLNRLKEAIGKYCDPKGEE